MDGYIKINSICGRGELIVPEDFFRDMMARPGAWYGLFSDEPVGEMMPMIRDRETTPKTE